MRTTLLALLTSLAACGGGGDAHPDGGLGPDAGDAAPGFRVDGIGTVALLEPYGAYVMLYDRPYEQPRPDRTATAGDCAVYHRRVPSCPAGCGAELCVADGQCAPGATSAEAGAIEITGLRQAATYTPSGFGYTGPTLPADFFTDDAAIHVSAAGGTIPAFTADVDGVAPLVTPASVVTLRDGEDATVTWTADGDHARIQLALYLGWHGAPWTDLLICETADDGELTVPAALVAQMPYFETGLFQWPSWIMRFHRAWVDTAAGGIEILAGSQIGLGLLHPAP